MHIQFSSRKYIKILYKITAVLVVVHVILQVLKFAFGHDQIFGLIKLFNLDEENNFPSLFSFMLFLIAAKLAGWITYDAWKKQKRFVWQWTGVSVFLLWFAADEILAIHERWSPVIREMLHTSGLFYYFWQLPYILIFIVMLVFYFPFLKSWSREFCARVFGAAFIFGMGVFVLEALGGWRYSITGPNDVVYMILATIEETCEMVGVIIFIYALLEYARQEIGEVHIEWQK
jgi:hypothetical protein